MNSYYQILGIAQDADKATVKKAYFKAIRKYTPEKDPQRFKEVREAYEILMDDQKRQDYNNQFKIDPVFQKAYVRVQELMGHGDYEGAIECCNEVLRISEEEEFLFLVGRLYHLNDNAGKELKIFEKLVKKFPENKDYQVYLAIAYQHRTWWKKSLQILDRLQKEHYQSLLFHKNYGIILADNEFQEDAAAAFQEGIEYLEKNGDTEKYLKDYSFMQAECIACRLNLEQGIDEPLLVSAMEKYYYFLEAHRERLFELREELFTMFTAVPASEKTAYAEIFQQFCELASELKGNSNLEPEYKMILSMYEGVSESARMEKDEQILPEMREDAQYFYEAQSKITAIKEALQTQDPELMEAFLEGAPEHKEFATAVIDLKLTILDQWDVAKEQMQRIKDYYPIFREILGDFVEEVLSGKNQRALWGKYETIYKKMNHLPAGGHLVRSDRNEVIFDSMEEGTYRRENKKIGRNDPCPCGSGKKYKNCCGR